ncbi:ribonuclease P protein component 4 [Thermogladius sp. 4427co]|uniref:ribonuclease P protein component 4 n=1 Tax=Thermogladius sp. 4427co TaxID=3450718 RepID=UPI003F78B67A
MRKSVLDRLLRDIALQRMGILYKLSLEAVKTGDKELARRYIGIIIEIAGKSRTRPPRYIRRGYCRRCRIPLIPGLTARYRIVSEGRGSRLVVTCLECGWRRRFMIKSRRNSEKGLEAK